MIKKNRKEVLSMGFFLTDSGQVRLKISDEAYQILVQDINDFRSIPEKEQMSSFLNRMIKNFYLKSKSTISAKRADIEKKYLLWLSDYSEGHEIAKLLTGKVLQEKKKELIAQYPRPKRGTGKSIKFIPDKITYDLLKHSIESELYEGNPAEYLALMVQEYTSLPREKRELIYFGDIAGTIENCIGKKEVELRLYNDDIYILRPYSIMTDGLSPWNYIIGYAYPQQKEEEEKLYSFRLQRITSVKEWRKFHFSDSEETVLKEIIKNNSQIPYLAGKTETITVRLTATGMELYQHHILTNRPNYTNKQIKKESIYLTFQCTQAQIYRYFIKFGENAEIISPLDLREKFKKIYHSLVKYYK